MIKIRISYTSEAEFEAVISELKSFKIKVKKEQPPKGKFKNRWVELQYIG